jgi:L-malate glycosyltransferase
VKPAIAFVWGSFGPYHVDRLEAAAAALSETHRVIGIEIAGSTDIYAWDRTERVEGAERITLFPAHTEEEIPAWRKFVALLRTCRAVRARHVFLCNFNEPQTFPLAIWLRLTGRTACLMMESKFDDKPRLLWREMLKRVLYLPYGAALVGGSRHRDYLRFFGFKAERIEFGYDTVSSDRVRRLSGSAPAPGGAAFQARHFTIVARLVPKKNVAMALGAYALYVRRAGEGARELHICGSGPLERELRAQADKFGLSSVRFRGFVQAPEIARTLAQSLALVLPSTEEQWGLAVNEAVAMGLPILCSWNVGARDALLRTAVNGYAFEPDNPAGLARLMEMMASDEGAWRRMAEASSRLAPLGDARRFGAAVARLVRGLPAASADLAQGPVDEGPA